MEEMFSVGEIGLLGKNETQRNIDLTGLPLLFIISITSPVLLSPVWPSLLIPVYHHFSLHGVSPLFLTSSLVSCTLSGLMYLFLSTYSPIPSGDKMPFISAPFKIILFSPVPQYFSYFSRLHFVSSVYFSPLTPRCYPLIK